MEPLFQAIVHGCAAGLHQVALNDVFWKRIEHEEAKYGIHKLADFGAQLSVVANFFDDPWSKPVKNLFPTDRRYLLSAAGFLLRGVGRLDEATQAARASFAAAEASREWSNAAGGASNLAELLLLQGDIAQAEVKARHGVKLAEDASDRDQRMINLATLADVLTQRGEFATAERLITEAEAIQVLREPA